MYVVLRHYNAYAFSLFKFFYTAARVKNLVMVPMRHLNNYFRLIGEGLVSAFSCPLFHNEHL